MIANIVVDVGGLTTAVIGLGAIFWQIRSAAHSLHDERLRSVQEATLDFWTATLEKRDQWRAVLPDDRSPVAVAEFLPNAGELTSEINKTIASYLNYYEALATGIYLGIYDIETIDYLAGPRITKLFENYRPWIIDRRTAFDERTLFVEFEFLAAEIRRRRELRPVR
jgi:hypothetical protein